MKIDYTNKTVFITGATKGIGGQIADEMEMCGAKLLLTGDDKQDVERLNKNAEKKGLRRRYYVADFVDAKSVDLLMDQICSEGRIDVCVNNAGINRIDDISDVKERDWSDMMLVNLQAPLMITKRVSAVMKSQCYGRIVNIASIFGVISKSKRSLYSITKFGLRGLTVAAALDLAPHNVLVNSVSPGFVMTELTKRILKPNEIEQLQMQVPLRRFANPEEISKVVLFIASDLNTYITGHNIVVDGGFINV